MEAIQLSDTVSGILQSTLLIVFNLEALPCHKVLKYEFIASCGFVFSFYTLRKGNLYLNSLLFADDQVIIQDSEKLQEFVYILNQMSKDYKLKISTDKTKIMAFKGKHLVRSKIEIDGLILDQVKKCNYLGCELSLDGEPDFDKKKREFKEYAALLENT